METHERGDAPEQAGFESARLSLLWPATYSEPQAGRLAPETIRDLELERTGAPSRRYFTTRARMRA
jgi:hypothetical protein